METATHSSILALKKKKKTLGQRSLVDYSPRGSKESDMTWVTGHTCPCCILYKLDTKEFYFIYLFGHKGILLRVVLSQDKIFLQNMVVGDELQIWNNSW